MRAWWAFGGVLLMIGGCCRHGAPVVLTQKDGSVAVLEQSVRSDDANLPLTAGGKANPLKYLAAGGNRDRIGEDLVIPDAPQRYGPLLDALTIADNLDPEDLSGPVYARWFKSPPVQQVIDARQPAPAVLGHAFAVTDGNFWWVFRRPANGKLTSLVVFKTLGEGTRPEIP